VPSLLFPSGSATIRAVDTYIIHLGVFCFNRILAPSFRRLESLPKHEVSKCSYLFQVKKQTKMFKTVTKVLMFHDKERITLSMRAWIRNGTNTKVTWRCGITAKCELGFSIPKSPLPVLVFNQTNHANSAWPSVRG